MANDVRKLFLTCTLFIGVMCVSAQLSQHGLIVNGSIGDEDSKIDKPPGGSWYELGYKAGFSVGYRLRFNKPTLHSFHFDMDVNIGARILSPVSYSPYGIGGGGSYTPDRFISIGGTANYSFIKKFSIGLGVEPAYYFKKGIPGSITFPGHVEDIDWSRYFDRKNRFDIPVVAKIAYNFNRFEVGIVGKYGMINVLETEHFKYGKFRDVQLSIFIPFKTK